jgi:cell division protein FtsW (lipid II flippase)
LSAIAATGRRGIAVVAGWRWTEFFLLLIPLLVLGSGLASLSERPSAPTLGDLWPVVVLGAVVYVAHVVLGLKYRAADQLLLPIAAMLCAFGLLVVARIDLSASYADQVGSLADGAVADRFLKPALMQSLLVRQGAFVAAGLILFLAVIFWKGILARVARLTYLAGAVALFLLMLTAVAGKDPNGSGARIELGFGPATFQTSEIVKLLMVGFLASYLSERRELLASSQRFGPFRLPALAYLVPLAAMMGACVLVIFVQKDLGVALLLFGVFTAMLYGSTGRLFYPAIAVAFLAAAGPLAYRMVSVARVRVDTWLDPWHRYLSSEAGGQGYQIVQALVTFASGGVLGTGIRYGLPDLASLLPGSYTDFPFAVIGESFGLVGTLGIVALYMAFTMRGFAIAIELGDGFRGLFAMGLASAVGIQALIILAGDLKLIPLTGITLPFISYGGSSLLVNFIILALLLRLSAERRPAL